MRWALASSVLKGVDGGGHGRDRQRSAACIRGALAPVLPASVRSPRANLREAVLCLRARPVRGGSARSTRGGRASRNESIPRGSTVTGCPAAAAQLPAGARLRPRVPRVPRQRAVPSERIRRVRLRPPLRPRARGDRTAGRRVGAQCRHRLRRLRGGARRAHRARRAARGPPALWAGDAAGDRESAARRRGAAPTADGLGAAAIAIACWLVLHVVVFGVVVRVVIAGFIDNGGNQR
mmetsp:Transcript_33903/g.104677  ORF Transcript_33903/g.104677 Transcript_33903/m.104677 type:complete len:236 (+) Transcript_33903:43-750(+)